MPLEHSEDISHHSAMAAQLDQTRQEVAAFEEDDAEATQGCLKALDTFREYLESHSKVCVSLSSHASVSSRT